MDTQIFDKALENLTPEIGHEAEWKECAQNEKKGIDAQLTFVFHGKKKIRRNAVIRREIRKHHVAQLKHLQEEAGPVMLIAEKLYPNIKTMLNEAGIDWMDTAGNIRLKEKETNIWIDGHTTKPLRDTKLKNRAFTKTGLKVVFLFLHDETWLNRTYREIAEAADVALGNIKYVLDGLREHGFILAKTQNVMQLKNRDKMLDQWITAFADELKPRIIKGRYTFINKETEQNWKDMNLGPDTVWGGEPAADLLTHNLKPLNYIIYTRRSRGELMKNFKLMPDKEGNIEVREPYWTVDNPHPKTAPMLTIYTDLMETGDPRNINIANQLYETAAEY